MIRQVERFIGVTLECVPRWRHPLGRQVASSCAPSTFGAGVSPGAFSMRTFTRFSLRDDQSVAFLSRFGNGFSVPCDLDMSYLSPGFLWFPVWRSVRVQLID